MPEEWQPCARAEHCAEIVVSREGGQTSRYARFGPRLLCETDRSLLALALTTLPTMYAALDRALTETVQPSDGPKVSGTPEKSIPIRVDVNELMTDVAVAVFGSERAVRKVARLTAVHRIKPSLANVTGACQTLATHVDVLLALPGAQAAALDLFSLHWRARSKLGLNGRRVPVPGPCPSCELHVLVRWETDPDYTEGITCTNCGQTHTRDDYAQRIAAALEEQT